MDTKPKKKVECESDDQDEVTVARSAIIYLTPGVKYIIAPGSVRNRFFAKVLLR